MNRIMGQDCGRKRAHRTGASKEIVSEQIPKSTIAALGKNACTGACRGESDNA